jgi:hypothetical protein
LATPRQEGAVVHREGGHQAAVLHQYPDSPWNDVVEYKFSLTHMVGFLFQRVLGQRQGEVKIPHET